MSPCSLWVAPALLTLTGQRFEVVFPQQSRGSNQKTCRQSGGLEISTFSQNFNFETEFWCKTCANVSLGFSKDSHWISNHTECVTLW